MHRKPAVKVTAAAPFKASKLTLSPMALSIAIVGDVHGKSQVPKKQAISFEEANFEFNGTTYRPFIRPTLAWPRDNKPSTAAVCAYAVVQTTYNPNKANAIASSASVAIKFGKRAVTINVPTIVNTADVQDGDEIILLQTFEKEAVNDAPPPKKQRVDASATEGKGGKSGKGGHASGGKGGKKGKNEKGRKGGNK